MDADALTERASGLSLIQRLGLLVALLVGEKLVANQVTDMSRALSAQGVGEAFRIAQHWGFRLLVALLALIALLAASRKDRLAGIVGEVRHTTLRLHWLLLHACLVGMLLLMSSLAFRPGIGTGAFAAICAAAIPLGAGAILTAALTVATAAMWRRLFDAMTGVRIWAVVMAVGAVGVGALSQGLWPVAAAATFVGVQLVLAPFFAALEIDPVERVIGTGRFAVEVLESCSGLEGIALMLAFVGGWLLLFRHEFRFPRALWLLVIGTAAMFVLNVLRICLLLVIGHLGYPAVAIYGFHSQAGWLAFIAAACGLIVLSRRPVWRSAVDTAGVTTTRISHPATPFLLPLIVWLLSGMLSRALSAGFEELYPLRVVLAAAVVWRFRRSLAVLEWRSSARGVGVGIAVFALWFAVARVLVPSTGPPEALLDLSPLARVTWIACRALGGVVVVPIVEELAYRGYLMRRWVRADFERVPFRQVNAMGIASSAIVFGLGHGVLWPAGIVAGIAYGALLVRTGRMGEAVAAHATTNLLIATTVLSFGQWQLW